jgi:hypothetical protein
MPSSTSSFERVIPDRRWLRMAAVSVALTTLLLSGWEILARRRGFAAGLDDTPELWAATRRSFDAAPRDGIVLVGSSRMLFDFDLDVAEQALGVRPIELAVAGSNELAGLEHIAAVASFHGTVLVSYVPHLTFLPPDAATGGLKKRIASYERGSLAQRVSYRMFQWLDGRLAFINGGELTIRKMIEQLDVPQRAGAEPAAMFLPYLVSVDADRRGRLFDGVLTDPGRRDQIRAAWLFPDAPSTDPVEQQIAERETIRQQVLWRERAAVDKIRARGGRVIYIRFPSSGGVLANEETDLPRNLSWDALLAVTGAPGIHFQDYPQLASFDCPEWSHLSNADSIEFTRRLMPILKPLLR